MCSNEAPPLGATTLGDRGSARGRLQRDSDCAEPRAALKSEAVDELKILGKRQSVTAADTSRRIIEATRIDYSCEVCVKCEAMRLGTLTAPWHLPWHVHVPATIALEPSAKVLVVTEDGFVNLGAELPVVDNPPSECAFAAAVGRPIVRLV